MSSGGGQHLIWNATTIENFFQLTERGKYWLDVGLFAEYAQETGPTEPSGVTFGPLLYKEIPNVLGVDTAHKLNVLFSRDVGPNSSKATGLFVAWQSVALLHPLFAPGFEYYGIIDDISHAGTFNQQQHFVGPVLTGEQSFSPFGKLKYEVGYLFGMTTATPKGSVRWKLEYEFVF